VAPHDCYLTTGETVGTPSARFSDCGLQWHRIRPPVCLDLWPFTYDPHAEAFTTVSSWSTTDYLKVTENGKTVLRENTKRVAFLQFESLPRQRGGHVPLFLRRRGRSCPGRDQPRLRAPLPRGAGYRRDVLRFEASARDRVERHPSRRRWCAMTPTVPQSEVMS